MREFTALLRILILQKIVTLFVSLAPAIVQQKLSQIPSNLKKKSPSILGTQVSCRYKIAVNYDGFTIEGPFGHRTMPLLARGTIQLNIQNQQTLIQLNIRPTVTSSLQVILGLGLYFGWACYIFREVFLVFIVLLFIQGLFMYGIILFNFYDQSNMIVSLIKEYLDNQAA